MNQHDTLISTFLAQQESCNSAFEAIAKATTATALMQLDACHLVSEAIANAVTLAQSTKSAFQAIADASALTASASMASIVAAQNEVSAVQLAIQAHSDMITAVSDSICRIDAETSKLWQGCIESSYPEPYALSNDWDITIPGVPNVGTEMALVAAQYGKAELVALERELKAGCVDFDNVYNAFTAIDPDWLNETLIKYSLLCRFASRIRSSVHNVVRFILRIAFAIPQHSDFELCGVLNTYRSFFELHGMGRPPCLGWAS